MGGKQESYPLIRNITLSNFKSYGTSVTMPLSALTMIIGANASGKSNVLEAIRLLSWLAQGSRLDDIERKIQGTVSLVRGQARDLFYNPADEVAVGCVIDGMPEGWNNFSLGIQLLNQHLVICRESIGASAQKVPLYTIVSACKETSDEISVQYNNFTKGRNKPQIPCSNRQAVFYQLTTPARFAKDHADSQHIIPAVANGLCRVLRSLIFLDPQPSTMRSYKPAFPQTEISEDGSNVSSVLYHICRDNKTLGDKLPKQHLLEFIRSLPEQDIIDVTFIVTERNDVMMRLIESFGGKQKEVDAPLLSDGTLRVLAVAGTLLTAAPGTLVVIEEIDNGVHPSRARHLMDKIKEISELKQLRVLITSHNPALVDALPDHVLGDVLCCYRDPVQGDSRMIQLRQFERFPELIARGTLGQVMTKGILDRFLKDPTPFDTRKQAALSWIDSLKTSAGNAA